MALFSLSIVFFIAHSMDAVNKQEWRMMGLGRLNESAARSSFIIAHVVILSVLLFFILTLGSAFLFLINALLILHAFVHYLCRNNYENQFKSIFSNFLIYGAGMLTIWHTVFWAIHLS